MRGCCHRAKMHFRWRGKSRRRGSGKHRFVRSTPDSVVTHETSIARTDCAVNPHEPPMRQPQASATEFPSADSALDSAILTHLMDAIPDRINFKYLQSQFVRNNVAHAPS